MTKIIQFNRESAADAEWQAITLPVATVLATALHLVDTPNLPRWSVFALRDIVRNCESCLAIQRSVLKSGYSSANDAGLFALLEPLETSLDIVRGTVTVHEDFTNLMAVSLAAMKDAIERRGATRAAEKAAAQKEAARAA